MDLDLDLDLDPDLYGHLEIPDQDKKLMRIR